MSFSYNRNTFMWIWGVLVRLFDGYGRSWILANLRGRKITAVCHHICITAVWDSTVQIVSTPPSPSNGGPFTVFGKAGPADPLDD